MEKILLFGLLFLFNQIAFSQKVVVGLHKMKSIYIGMDNYLSIAVEGYTESQLTIDANGCKVLKDTISNQYTIRAVKEGNCKVFVSYTSDKGVKIDTLNFKIKPIPRPESYFGNLESGIANFHDLMNQNNIRAVIPHFYVEDSFYKVTKYNALYVPKRGNVIAYEGKGNQIPIDLKYRLMGLVNGDKILVDDIYAVNPDGFPKRLMPIVITVVSSNFKEWEDAPNFYQYIQTREDSLATINKNSFSNDPWGVYKNGITKGFKVNCGDTQLIFEVKKMENKILWEKQFYVSGKLKANFNFENNDTLGDAISYYENGNLKFKGKILPKLKSVFPHYRAEVSFGHCVNYDPIFFKDSFFLNNYVPYGNWQCYGENGKMLMDCNFRLINYGKIPVSKNDDEFDFSNDNYKRRKATIKDALISKNSYFKVDFDGLFKTYDRQGRLTSKEYHENVPENYTKVLAHYEYYENDSIKEQYNFLENENLGIGKSYYLNGQIKAEGKILKGISLFEIANNKEKIDFLDTINWMRFNKIGNWKAYHSNGKLALECNFSIYGWLDLKKQLDYYQALENDLNPEVVEEEAMPMKQYSLDEVLKNPKNRFYTKLAGPCLIYDKKGKLVKTIIY